MAWRDSRRNRARLLLFISSIVVGIAAITAVQSFSENLKGDINRVNDKITEVIEVHSEEARVARELFVQLVGMVAQKLTASRGVKITVSAEVTFDEPPKP